MTDNYLKLAADNVSDLFSAPPPDLDRRLGGDAAPGGVTLKAFGRRWRLAPGRAPAADGAASVEALLVSIYAKHHQSAPLTEAPFIAFTELPGSAPYAAAFARHAQQALAPHVAALEARLDAVCTALDGSVAPRPETGDVVFTVRPLPKIALRYICYRADEDFPAAVTCLFSRNASTFMPTDALADVGEYTGRAIVSMLG